MVATQTGNNTISAHRTARKNSNAYIHIFELSDIENMDVDVGILFLAVLCAETVLLLV